MDTRRTYNNANMEKKRHKLLKQEQAALVLSSGKVRNTGKINRIDEAYEKAKEIQPGGSRRKYDKFVELFEGLSVENREHLYRLLKVVEKETDLFEDEHYCWKFINGCKSIAFWGEFWVNQPETWKCRTHNIERQFNGLLHHLLARYPIPSFMNEAFTTNGGVGSKKQEWFIHLGSGQNIRTASNLPYQMTKMMAHNFANAPASFKIDEAFQYARLSSIGANRNIINAWLGSRLSCDYTNTDFWDSVVRFFIDNPMLDTDQIAPIIDYLYNQRFQDVVELLPDGNRIIHPPPQPNLCMKGRQADTLVEQVEAWHRQTTKSQKSGYKEWKSCGISGGTFEEGAGNGKKVYVIAELLTSSELKEEGREMHHCVATYASSCATGIKAVYSLRQTEGRDSGRKATISISLGDKSIQEARGKYNEVLPVSISRIIRTWANMRGLSISSWAKV